MLDRSKLPPNFWVRMVWVPRDRSKKDLHPVVLVTDRRRFWIVTIPMLVAFLLAVVLALLRAPFILVLILVLVVISSSYLGRGSSGYYQVREDGSLGDFLGRRMPPALREMQREKPPAS